MISDKVMTVLVTGSSGMIGSETVKGLISKGYRVIGVDCRDTKLVDDNYIHKVLDLSDREKLGQIVVQNNVERIIHLAALAHASDGREYTWDDYYHLNVECSKNVFDVANDIPVLFISTVDVFGFTNGVVNSQSVPNPVSNYAKSKVMAEIECKKLANYTVFRFSPVYTDTVKRDIQKRYYLKYPNIAYRIGKGTEYEILNVKKAVREMVTWCEQHTVNAVRIIKDDVRMNTADVIKEEKLEGRANVVLRFPRWMVRMVYVIIKAFSGENKYTYLLNKAVCPLRTE